MSARARGRAAVEDLASELARGGAHVDDPVGGANDVEIVLDDEERVAALPEPSERGEERLGVGRVEPRGGLVEHVDDPEEVRAHLGRETQALELTGREGGRRTLEREVAEPEVHEDRETRAQVLRDATRDLDLLGMGLRELRDLLRGAVRVGTQELGEALQRDARHVRDVEPGERDRQRSLRQALALAERAFAVQHVLRDSLLDARVGRRREGAEHVLLRAREVAHVAGRLLPLDRALGLGEREAGVDRSGDRLLGEQDEIPELPRQVAPRNVDVVAERREDVAKVLSLPRGGHAATARSRIVFDGSGTIDASVTS